MLEVATILTYCYLQFIKYHFHFLVLRSLKITFIKPCLKKCKWIFSSGMYVQVLSKRLTLHHCFPFLITSLAPALISSHISFCGTLFSSKPFFIISRWCTSLRCYRNNPIKWTAGELDRLSERLLNRCLSGHREPMVMTAGLDSFFPRDSSTHTHTQSLVHLKHYMMQMCRFQTVHESICHICLKVIH